MGFEHRSVLPGEVHEYQNLKPGNICVDCTLGGAGHALSTVRAIQPGGLLIGIDQDMDALSHAKNVLLPFENSTNLFHSNFSDLPEIMASSGIDGAHSILIDLGFSLNQIRNSNRGFSFQTNEPLDMRMDVRNSLTAENIINTWSEKDLKAIFFKYGEERFSARIARSIAAGRTKQAIKTTAELSGIIVDAVPKKFAAGRKIHPATQVFQALRIAVNKELERLERFMEQVPDLLVKGGRICVISFHSLEDRIVKHAIRKFESGCSCPKELPHCMCGFEQKLKRITRKPVIPSPEEIAANPMARSSKLRVAQKV